MSTGKEQMNPHLLQMASELDVDEQIDLVDAIWEDIGNRGAAPLPTEAQKIELDRRLADYLAYPEDAVPWQPLKAAAMAKISR
jgi:putative addiction module component (TIGR02574 family)